MSWCVHYTTGETLPAITFTQKGTSKFFVNALPGSVGHATSVTDMPNKSAPIARSLHEGEFAGQNRTLIACSYDRRDHSHHP